MGSIPVPGICLSHRRRQKRRPHSPQSLTRGRRIPLLNSPYGATAIGGERGNPAFKYRLERQVQFLKRAVRHYGFPPFVPEYFQGA